MAYISESNAINGWFRRYALVEFYAPFTVHDDWSNPIFDADELPDLVLQCYTHSHGSTLFYKPLSSDLDYIYPITNELFGTVPDMLTPISFVKDHRCKKEGLRVKILIPVINDVEEVRKLIKRLNYNEDNDINILSINEYGEAIVHNIDWNCHKTEKITPYLKSFKINPQLTVIAEYEWKQQ